MKRKLTIYIFLIAAAAVLASTVTGVWVMLHREQEAAKTALNQSLALMDAQGEDTDVAGLISLFERATPDLRLTFIAPDGAVLGDTHADTDEDHSGRPEVEQALAAGYGEDVRRSTTTGVITVYVARQFRDGIVGRAAQPVYSVNALVLQSAASFGATALLVMLLALLLARRLAVRTVRPVEEAEVAVRHVDETLQSARSEFTANVTHELKTPLTSIKGFTDMMASGLVKEPEDQKRFLTMISVEVDRLTKLVDDILKVSELEAVGAVSAGESAEVLDIARDVEDFLAPAAERAQVTLTVTGEVARAAAGGDRVREVALNLMENAIKYNRPGGRVDVSVRREGGRVAFSVADTGIGIPAESQPRIFERFYRVDKGRSRAAGGTGLGLAIVKHIVMLYGGEITLASAVGEGTTITVYLPEA